MIGECLLCSPPPRLSLVLTFIAAAIILAAAVTLTNFAQAEVTGKVVPPTNGMCPIISGVGPVGIGAWSDSAPRPAVICLENSTESLRYNAAVSNVGTLITFTVNTTEYVVETRAVGQLREAHIVRTIVATPPPPTPPDDGNTQNPQTPAATVQAKSSNDAKRLAQYGAAGFAAFVLIHNYWLGAPLGVLPLNMAYNDKGAIFSGTSFRLSPNETVHLSALESLDDKRGEYKFGVQWHYQFAPPRGLTETPAAALPAIYTMPNVKPKDWLSDDEGIRRGNDR